jgi:4-hydroxybenzoyl-CoA thioesterase
MSAPYRHRRLIRFADCDPAGIVYFPRFFDFFHAAVEDWYREALDIDYWGRLMRGRIGFPAVRAECDYKRPCRLGEPLEIAVLVERVGGRSLTLRFPGSVDGEPRLEGRIICAITSLDSHRSIAMPADLRAAYERYFEACRASA